MKDEELLIQKAKQGDERAFGSLYDTNLSPIYRFIFLRVGRKEDAEDITQKVFMNAWENIGHFEFKGFPFSSWLYRIASNAVIDYYRTWKGDTDIEAVPEEYFSETPKEDERIDTAFNLTHVRAALAKLEPDQQNVVIMKFISERSNKEIAETLGKSEGAIRVIQHRALKQLKAILDEGPSHHTTEEA